MTSPLPFPLEGPRVGECLAWTCKGLETYSQLVLVLDRTPARANVIHYAMISCHTGLYTWL